MHIPRIFNRSLVRGLQPAYELLMIPNPRIKVLGRLECNLLGRECHSKIPDQCEDYNEDCETDDDPQLFFYFIGLLSFGHIITLP